jgi:hypothetical protein
MSRLRWRSGSVSRHAVMASAFSCNSMATERVAAGIRSKPCALIQAPNSKP